MVTATRLFVSQDLTPGCPLSLEPAQAHYLHKVLRLGSGAAIVLFNGRDGEWHARIETLSKSGGMLNVTQKRREQVASPDLWLAFAPVKKTQTDFIIQKATELGVSRLIPIITEHTQTGRVKTTRLQMVAIEAAEQSERLDVPQIEDPMRLEDVIHSWPEERACFVCAETGPIIPIVNAVQGQARAGFVTGPEGGFSSMELDFMRNAKQVQAVGLGPRILRAETAALSALAIWQAVAGDGAMPPLVRD